MSLVHSNDVFWYIGALKCDLIKKKNFYLSPRLECNDEWLMVKNSITKLPGDRFCIRVLTCECQLLGTRKKIEADGRAMDERDSSATTESACGSLQWGEAPGHFGGDD